MGTRNTQSFLLIPQITFESVSSTQTLTQLPTKRHKFAYNAKDPVYRAARERVVIVILLTNTTIHGKLHIEICQTMKWARR